MVAESTKWEMMVDALAAAFLVRRRCVEDALLGLSEQLFKTVVDCPPQLADLFIVLATHAASIAPGLPLAGE